MAEERGRNCGIGNGEEDAARKAKRDRTEK
jgi:hypothetical protein